jgi:hypothetical protein
MLRQLGAVVTLLLAGYGGVVVYAVLFAHREQRSDWKRSDFKRHV